MKVGALFAGVGGLEQGLAQVLPDTELAWVSEIDKAATRVLGHRYGVPNHGDITRIDWQTVEPVDVLTGGWPCQPWSTAGLRKGIDDDRALWPHVADAVRALRPRLVLLENVAAIAPAGELGRAVGDLASLGYVGSWRCLRAADVGAPHRRARIFITAHPAADPGGDGQGRIGETTAPRWAHRDGSRRTVDGRDTAPVEDADVEPRHQRRITTPRQETSRGTRPNTGGSSRGRASADTDSATPPADATFAERRGPEQHHLATPLGSAAEPRERDSATAWGQYEPAIRRWEHLTRPAPPPTVLSAKGNPRLSGAFTEWLMGYPAGWITDVPGISNNDALRLCGNGVVPQQAAAALTLMLGVPPAAVTTTHPSTLLPTPVTAYSARSPEQWRTQRPAGNGATRDLIGDLRVVIEELQSPHPSTHYSTDKDSGMTIPTRPDPTVNTHTDNCESGWYEDMCPSCTEAADATRCHWCQGTGVYSDEVMSMACPYCAATGEADQS